jgi:hypothetical protein
MFAMSIRDPTFSDDEVGEIFAAAAERQSEAEDATAVSGGGHSLAELKRIGAEAGIDPAHVEAAARALVRRAGRLPSGQHGARHAVEVKRTLPAATDDGAWQRVVRALREEFRCTGVTTRFGETREWISSAEGPSTAAIEARLETEGGETRLVLRQDRGAYRQLGTALGLGFGGTGAIFAGLMAVGNFAGPPLALPLAFLGLGAATWAGHRALSPWIEGRQRARFERIADRIDLIARESGASGAP